MDTVKISSKRQILALMPPAVSRGFAPGNKQAFRGRMIFLNSLFPLIASAQPGKLLSWFDGAFSPRGQRETHF
jgi:hypothetical protein